MFISEIILECNICLNTPLSLPCTQLCLFAEGTRFTPEKHEVSKEFARSRGLPILKHHLVPRTKGFNFILKHMDGVCECLCEGV